jgi:hypothetical protein
VISLGIFSEASEGNVYPGVGSASENECQEPPGGKDGRRKGDELTTFIVPKVEKIRKP